MNELICSSFGHYQGKPLSLLFGVDSDDGVDCLFLMKEESFDFDGKHHCFVISDTTSQGEVNQVFESKDFTQAFYAYQELRTSNRLDIPDELFKHLVDNAVQLAGVNDSGRFTYNIDGLSNGNMALLGACLWFMKNQATGVAMNAVDELIDQLDIYTID